MKKNKICFLAPSGFGKSTCALYLKENYQGEVLKLATPLYEIQKHIYEKIGLNDQGLQDGELLQFLGHKIQNIAPDFLAQEFLKKVNNSNSKLIINDDCRPHNYLALKKNGFIFIKINGICRDRKDLSLINKNHVVEWQDTIPFDYTVDNLKDLKNLHNQLDKLMEIICG